MKREYNLVDPDGLRQEELEGTASEKGLFSKKCFSFVEEKGKVEEELNRVPFLQYVCNQMEQMSLSDYFKELDAFCKKYGYIGSDMVASSEKGMTIDQNLVAIEAPSLGELALICSLPYLYDQMLTEVHPIVTKTKQNHCFALSYHDHVYEFHRFDELGNPSASSKYYFVDYGPIDIYPDPILVTSFEEEKVYRKAK